jgi:hypothetical protein
MEADALRSELDEVTSELTAARTEYAVLGAKIAGLEAQRAALTRALPGIERRSVASTSIAGKSRVEAIVELLRVADAEMSIKHVLEALRDTGRALETYDNVAADLAYLVERGRVIRIRRGIYTAAPDETRTDLPSGAHREQSVPMAEIDSAVSAGRRNRIEITVTEGGLKNGYISLAENLDFFPAESIGAANSSDGEGAPLRLYFEGLADTVDTDIAAKHKIFRRRGPWRKFLSYHDLQPGEKVTIEKVSEGEFRVYPAH